MPPLTCLGSQHPVDPHHSIECINRTEYTVGTVGISDIFCSVPGAAGCPLPCPEWYCVSLVSAQPSSARWGLRGLFSSASESHCVVSAFPRGSRALPCDHAEILYALANGLLWKLVNGFRHTLSQGPPQPLLGLASLTVDWAGAKQLCPWMPRHPPDTVIPPQTLPSWFPSPLRCFQTLWKLIFSLVGPPTAMWSSVQTKSSCCFLTSQKVMRGLKYGWWKWCRVLVLTWYLLWSISLLYFDSQGTG